MAPQRKNIPIPGLSMHEARKLAVIGVNIEHKKELHSAAAFDILQLQHGSTEVELQQTRSRASNCQRRCMEPSICIKMKSDAEILS